MRIVLAGLAAMSLTACPPGKGETAGGSTGGASSSSSGQGASTTTGGEPTTGDLGTSGSMDMTSGTPSTSGATGPDSTGAASTGDTTGSIGSTGSTGTGSTGIDTTGGTDTGGSTGATTGGESSLFPCEDCYCDAKTSYCKDVQAGVIDIPPRPEMCPIVPPDDLDSGCVPYPPKCGDTPTCDCIPTDNVCVWCAEDMGAITVTCPLP